MAISVYCLGAEARKRTALPCNFTVKFYKGKYFSSFGSIFPVEDIVKVIPQDMVSWTAAAAPARGVL